MQLEDGLGKRFKGIGRVVAFADTVFDAVEQIQDPLEQVNGAG
jgi:hypothetical protein